MRPSDVPFCVAQTVREGWTTTEEDFGVHLAHDPEGCFVAEAGGEPAAMVTTTLYRATAWIGNLIVVPAERGSGLGSMLMDHAIAHLETRGAATLRLEADPPGVNIYRRMGFVDEYESPRFRLDGAAGTGAPAAAPLDAGDVAAAAALDRETFGDDRSRLLRLLRARAHVAFRVPRRGRLAGYIMVLRGSAGLRIGPWVADEPGVARDLLLTALASVPRATVTLAVPGPNASAVALLRGVGFRETPSSLRMVRGAAAHAGRPETVFALANGALG